MNLKFILPVMALLTTSASAQDAPKPEAPAEPKAAASGAPAPTSTANAIPSPTKWVLELDQSDIATINQCIGELQFKVAQPFVQKVQSHLKPVQ